MIEILLSVKTEIQNTGVIT